MARLVPRDKRSHRIAGTTKVMEDGHSWPSRHSSSRAKPDGQECPSSSLSPADRDLPHLDQYLDDC